MFCNTTRLQFVDADCLCGKVDRNHPALLGVLTNQAEEFGFSLEFSVNYVSVNVA